MNPFSHAQDGSPKEGGFTEPQTPVLSPGRVVLIKLISTFFFVGYLPRMPGTFASIIAAAILLLIGGNTAAYISITLLCMFCGLLVSGHAEKIFARKDASCIVIDEVTGMFLSLLFIPIRLPYVVIAFVIFRLADIIKPYPINKVQKMPGSLGVMCDDILAAFYANIILQFILRLAFLRAS